MSISSPLLRCHQLSLTRGGRPILDRLDLTLQGGTLTALLGPNGAGKSSLLKCLTGELEYEGEINLFDRERQAWASRELAHRVGVLPQSSSLNFPFLCEEVVAMGRLPHTEPGSRRDEIVRAAMTHAGVEHLARRLYPGLSGGERQRVQFARVLAQIWQAPDDPQQARLLLLDEPTSALDMTVQVQIVDLLRGLQRKWGLAYLFISHDLRVVRALSHKVIVMRAGDVVEAGDGTAVFNAPQSDYTRTLMQAAFGS